jgi:hypothetical protein
MCPFSREEKKNLCRSEVSGQITKPIGPLCHALNLGAWTLHLPEKVAKITADHRLSTDEPFDVQKTATTTAGENQTDHSPTFPVQWGLKVSVVHHP